MDEQQTIPEQNKASKPIFQAAVYFLVIAVIFASVCITVYSVDPYFHFHTPNTEKYFYTLDDERGQNDGILRHFEYDAIIIGGPEAQNFKTSEVNEMFGVNAVKTTFSNDSYCETAARLRRGLSSNPNVKLVIRSLDMDCFFAEADDIDDTEAYPTYLYDDNLFNDYKYLLNRDVIFTQVYTILKDRLTDNTITGHTDFDTYDSWMWSRRGAFGSGNVLSGEELQNYGIIDYRLTNDQKLMIKENITANVLSIAEEYPDVDFYYFITPYSAVWWNYNLQYGTTVCQIQAEQYIIEMMLEYDNIHVFTYNDQYNMTTDLNNYTDVVHYGEWVNTAILRWMKDGIGLLTEDNYLSYIRDEFSFYSSFDYTTLNEQTDYDDEDAFATDFFENFFGTGDSSEEAETS